MVDNIHDRDYVGRAEFEYNGTTGYMCGYGDILADEWDVKNAHVVCRMLGFQ